MNPLPMNPENIDKKAPLKLHEAALASVVVVGACASLAICFVAVATCQSITAVFNRLVRKGGTHVP